MRLTRSLGFRSAGLILALAILSTYAAPATAAFRLQAYTMRCFGSPLGPVTGILVGRIETVARVLTFRATCDARVNNGYSQSIFPSVTMADGAVLKMNMTLTPTLDPTEVGAEHLVNACTGISLNGIIGLHCNVNSHESAAVDLHIAIAE
jgi:hypothetical protein